MAFVVAALGTGRTRQLVESVLGGAGHAVVSFGAGGPALAEVLAGLPDVVVLDDDLTGMTALHVRAAIRSSAPLAGIPIVICSTALADPQVRVLGARGDLVIGRADLGANLPAAVATALAGRPAPQAHRVSPLAAGRRGGVSAGRPRRRAG